MTITRPWDQVMRVLAMKGLLRPLTLQLINTATTLGLSTLWRRRKEDFHESSPHENEPVDLWSHGRNPY